MRNTFLTLACCAAAMMLSSVSANASDVTYVLDTFDSYTAGGAPNANWRDWETGTVPATGNTVLSSGGVGNSKCLKLGCDFAGIEPVRWFANPFDVNNREVVTTFYVKGDAGPQSVGASWFQFFEGSMGPVGTAQPGTQYTSNIGLFEIDGDSTSTTSPYAGATPVGWDRVVSPGPAFPILKDGTTWNKVEIHAVARNVDVPNNRIVGQAQATVSYVDASNQTHTWTSEWNDFQLLGEGMTGVALASLGTPATWYVDNYSVVQLGDLDLPENFPSPKSYFPGVHSGVAGGIATDGSRYLYATGGNPQAGGSGGKLFRCDLATNTWTQLPSRPDAATNPSEPHGLAVMANGKVVTYSRSATGTVTYEYNPATNAWSAPIYPAPVCGCWDSVQCLEGAGNLAYATMTISQGGFCVYNSATGQFLSGQGNPGDPGAGIGPSCGQPWGCDLAYDGSKNLYALGYNYITGKATISAWDTTLPQSANHNNWTPLGALADLPVSIDPSWDHYYQQHALAYVDADHTSLYVLHQGDWQLTGLYEIRIEGGGLFAAIQGDDNLYRYDAATNTWTTLEHQLPFVFGVGDDMSPGLTIAGDANGDGVVDVVDLNDVYNTLGTSGAGDTNGDGIVDVNDLNEVYNHLGLQNSWAGAGEPVPEPASFALLALGGAILAHKRRRQAGKASVTGKFRTAVDNHRRISMTLKGAVALLAVAMTASAAGAARDNVDLLIDTSLYSATSAAVNLYKADVEAHFNVTLNIRTSNFESQTPAQIRTYLQGEYATNQIKGVILAGQIPYAMWNGYQCGALSAFYEDMDGSFTDTNSDGYYDYHDWGTSQKPEIWSCWMRPPTFTSGGQTAQLNQFLAKTHNYYASGMTVPQRALFAGDNTYGCYNTLFPYVDRMFGTDHYDLEGWETDPNVRVNADGAKIANDLATQRYAFFDVQSHSAQTLIGLDTRSLFSSDVWDQATRGKGALIASIYGCRTADFNAAPGDSLANLNIALSFPFGPSISQAATGTAWSYGTEYRELMYDVLEDGGYLGEAWYNLISYVDTPQHINDRYWGRDVHLELAGNNLVGNPFVYLDGLGLAEVAPEPGTLTLLAIGCAAMLRRRRR